MNNSQKESKVKRMLIVTPSFSITGGVANHHQGLKPFWSLKVDYVFQGKRRFIPAILTLIPDFLWFVVKLLVSQCDYVMINPSLRRYQLMRESVYLLLARLFGKKVITFIHGWSDDYYNHLLKNPRWFCGVYSKSSLIFVLYSDFRNKLLNLHLECPIELTTTKVRQSLIDQSPGYDFDGKIKQLLFLARADRAKGLDIVVKTYAILKERHPELSLSICGDGDALSEMKAFVEENNLENAQFAGKVPPDDVRHYYEQCQVYLLPTTHGEGMATTVLEAMAMGLVVISRPVGGVNDFFEQGKMGYLLESLDPQDYASKILSLLDAPSKVKEISAFNKHYALQHFAADKVVKDLEQKIRANVQ